MSEFFAEHGEIVAAFISLLLTILVLLASALGRVQFRYIDVHQRRQDVRLETLEDQLSNLKGDSREFRESLRGISNILEDHFEELEKRLEDHQRANEDAHKDLKLDIKSLLKATKVAG